MTNIDKFISSFGKIEIPIHGVRLPEFIVKGETDGSKDQNFEFLTELCRKGYKKLSPKMKNAVDNIMKKMNDKPQNFLNSFDKSIKDTATKFKVTKNELMDYFEKELFAVM